MKKHKFDWQVVLSCLFDGVRPRRFSIHTIATMCERDPLVILDEMEKSGKVFGFYCYTVKTPVFVLNTMKQVMGYGSWDVSEPTAFIKAKEQLEAFPFPKYKGFYRYGGADPVVMECPFEPDDKDYEEKVRKELAEWRNA